MTALVNRVSVKTGDVFFVSAGVIHAIGAGCLILEVQEPTDFTIQPEYWCGDYHLNDREMYLGLERETALDCFDYTRFGEQVVAAGRKEPKVLHRDDTLLIEELIGADDTPCFSMERRIVTRGKTVLDKPASIWICVDGSGTLCSDAGERTLCRGDYFFLPASAAGTCTAQADSMTLVCCMGGE